MIDADALYDVLVALPRFCVILGHLEGPLRLCARCGPVGSTVRWQFDTESPTALCSPTVLNGTVYTGSTGDPGDLFALDARDGSAAWRFEGDGYFVATPCVTDEAVYAGTWGKAFYAIDRETGEKRWSVDLEHRIDSSSALVVDETVYVGTIGEAPLGITRENRDEQFGDGDSSRSISRRVRKSGDTIRQVSRVARG